jgi:hypothetical protein
VLAVAMFVPIALALRSVHRVKNKRPARRRCRGLNRRKAYGTAAYLTRGGVLFVSASGTTWAVV